MDGLWIRSRNWRRAGILAVVGMAMLAGCDELSDNLGSGKKRPPEEATLSTDYCPRTAGLTRPYLVRTHENNGQVSEAQYRLVWRADGDCDSWNVDQPRDKSTERWRVSGSFLENGSYDANEILTWFPTLKIGAQPGDSWTRNTDSAELRYTYKEFTEHNARPCAIVVYEYITGGQAKLQCMRWYIKHVGLVKEEARTWRQGRWEPYREFIYDEWNEGDHSTRSRFSGADHGSPVAASHFGGHEFRGTRAAFLKKLNQVKKAGQVDPEFNVFAADYEWKVFFEAFGPPSRSEEFQLEDTTAFRKTFGNPDDSLQLLEGVSQEVRWTYRCNDGDVVMTLMLQKPPKGLILLRGLKVER